MSKSIRLKLQSGALQFVVFIAILIALLLSGLMLYAYSFNYFKEQSKAVVRMTQISNHALAYFENNNTFFKDTTEIPELETENCKTKLHTSTWGLFLKASILTQHRKKTHQKTLLLGGNFETFKTPVLTLEESYNPLTLVGNTKIQGNVVLPTQGVKAGYIAGTAFYGTTLIQGNIVKNGKQLPKIAIPIHEQLISQQLSDFTTATTFEKNKSCIINSFKNPTKKWLSNQDIRISEQKLIGNIIIKSASKITISQTALLQDVLLIAPIIEIEDEVSGTFQALATTNIFVGKNCKLNYPSALVINNLETNVEKRMTNLIKIGENTKLNGVVAYIDDQPTLSDYKPKIIIDKEAHIKGQVYAMGALELKGTVQGALFVKEFITNEAGSTFINHLYNATITNQKLPAKYGGMILSKNNFINMKWLY